MSSAISPPRAEELLGPLLASLPAAAVSPSPPAALLPLLSPILRQRVQLLSSASQDPWLPLLCYDSVNGSRLKDVVKNERLEPHPVSGEVEVDWDSEVEIRYKRVDEETLQSLVQLRELALAIKLVWCVNDEVGGGDGWRIGEVSALDERLSSWGKPTPAEAEAAFETPSQASSSYLSTHNALAPNNRLPTPNAEEEDDDAYWAQYDNTPARTPAPKDTSVPANTHGLMNGYGREDEDSYYAQYAAVQPAMDNHDPDEAKENESAGVETTLGGDEVLSDLQQHLSSSNPAHVPDLHGSSMAWSQDSVPRMNGSQDETEQILAQPRPGSSTGSSGSDTVARLERRAARESRESREQSEVAVAQHIGTSVKSLFRLARAAGIERKEFERIVTTELECLRLMDEDD